VYATYLHLDKYQYDIDILEAIKNLAIPHELDKSNQVLPPIQGRRIRLAYLVYGASHANSVLVKIMETFANFHDQTVFDVGFFVPESLTLGQKSRTSKLLASNGAKFFVAPWSYKDDSPDSLTTFASEIRKFGPDLLITTAGLAAFEHYFLALLRPAPLVVSLLQGPPQQFTARGFDHAISWSRHPLIDSPVDTTLVKLGVSLPDSAQIPIISRNELGIPDGAVILMSAGRYVKFQNREFWQNLIELLRAQSDTYYVVVGAERNQVPCISDFAIDLVESGRICFLGWRKDCLSLLKCADIVIDTYPSGGGHVLVDAMAIGKPFVSFTNDYLHAFDQTDWSVAEEFVAIPELIVQRGNFGKFNEMITKLISDAGFRNEMGEKCYRQIRIEMPTERAGVLSLENEYVRLLNTKGQHVDRLGRPDCIVQEKTTSTIFHKSITRIKKIVKHVFT
jgi:predicted O-linked N-acetylglucosamine transferase (SPINDLY family)